MNEEEFEGTLILEELASVGLLEEFYEAIDSDNLAKIIALMRKVDIDQDVIMSVLKKIKNG